MQWLAALSVRRAVFASVLILVIVVFGSVGYVSLGVDKFPQVDFPMVTISTEYKGASPAAVEIDVTDPIEGVVNTVSGIETLTSISSEGRSSVFVQFELEKDVDVAAQEVRDRVASVMSDLPSGIEDPVVQKMDPDSVPILNLSVKGALPPDELTRVAEDIVKRRIETIKGVGEVKIIGGRKRRINIDLDPVRMEAASVTALEVKRAIGVSNDDVPAGRLDKGPTEATIRIVGRVGSPEQLGDVVVRQNGEHTVRLRDVATVEDGVEDAETSGARNGESTVVLAVRKQTGGNTVEAVDLAKAAVAELAPRLPPGVSLEIVRDNSDTIRTSIHSVLEHLILGGILAALVVLIFLGDWRSTLISAISIPVSLVGTFALMSWAGFTLNMMTLLALALSVGIVIDDSIVVLENIHRYIHEKGMKPFPAAIAATKEIGMAVLATTLSLMAVFIPVAFMDGIVGRFLASFGLSMAFAVGISMIVSFTIVPMLGARFLPPAPAEGHVQRRSVMVRIVDAFYAPIEWAYMALLRFSMKQRWLIVGLSVASLAAIPVLAKMAGGGFLPVNDEAQFEIYVEAPAGTSIDATSVIAERIARRTRALEGVAYTLTTIGDTGQKERNIARIYVRLIDPVQRPDLSQEEIIASARKAMGNLPAGTTATVAAVADFSNGAKNAAIQYILSGPDLQQLETYASQAAAEFAKVPGVVDVDTSAPDAVTEAVLRPDFDRASALGVDPGDVSATLGVVVGGVETSKYLEDGRQYDVFVRAAEAFRGDTADLGALTVPSRTLGQVPLSDVVMIEETGGPSIINRMSRERQITLTANMVPGGDQGAAMAALEKIIDELHMEPGYTSEATGQSKEMKKMGVSFLIAFVLAFVFMYLILAAQFESWLHPLTILSALPLTVPFAFLSLVLFGEQINLFSMLGLLVLFGVVKKNSILQIDQTNTLRAQGMPRAEAILEANRHRLRPILMTTIAFVAGMLPLVFSHGIGSGFSRAMATIVVGGQTLSLLLTLLAVPVIYSLFDDIGLAAGRLKARMRRGERVDRGAAEVGAYGAEAVG